VVEVDGNKAKVSKELKIKIFEIDFDTTYRSYII